MDCSKPLHFTILKHAQWACGRNSPGKEMGLALAQRRGPPCTKSDHVAVIDERTRYVAGTELGTLETSH